MKKVTKTKITKGFNISMIVLAFIALVTSAFVIYQFATTKKPWTLATTYASKLTANENNEDIVKVNIKSNANNNGETLYDVQFNSYTDVDGNGISGFGIQAVGNYDLRRYWLVSNDEAMEFSTKIAQGYKWLDGDSILYGDIYLYYTGDKGTTYIQLSENMLDDYLLIDINQSFYRLTLKNYNYQAKGSAKWYETQYWFKDKYETRTAKYTWYHVFDYIIQSALSSSGQEEYQEFPLSLLDCSEFMSIEYKDDRGQYHPLEKTSDQRNYLTIQCEFDKDGATEIIDSMFKQVAGSTTWSYYNNTDAQDYWSDYTTITLNENNLVTLKGENSKLTCLSIDPMFAKYLLTLSHATIKFNINMDNLKDNANIYAIDMTNFNTLKITDFVIRSANKRDFHVFNADEITPTLRMGV